MAIQAISNGFLGAVSSPIASLGNLSNRVNQLFTQMGSYALPAAIGAVGFLARESYEFLNACNREESCSSEDARTFIQNTLLVFLGCAGLQLFRLSNRQPVQRSLASLGGS